MGSIIGQKIDYNGRGSKRPAAHTQQTLTQVLPPPPPHSGSKQAMAVLNTCIYGFLIKLEIVIINSIHAKDGLISVEGLRIGSIFLFSR